MQKYAPWITFVAHELIILPLSYYLGFYVGTNENPITNNRGMELKGIWIAMCIGVGVQAISYYVLF